MQLEAIELPIYTSFAIGHFKDAYALTPQGETCDISLIDQLINDFVAENDYRIRELLAYISEPQKEVLYAIHDEGEVKSISSAAFTKK